MMLSRIFLIKNVSEERKRKNGRERGEEFNEKYISYLFVSFPQIHVLDSKHPVD